MSGPYTHVEAFCLMKYATDDGSEIEWLWNSRDGVTPFCITSRSGKEMRHVDWQFDVRMPWYKPRKGERIFVDLTREKAEEYARRRVEMYWDDPDYPMRKAFPSKDVAVAEMADSMLEHPGAPDVVEVLS